jgi:hypothetical protein
MTTLLPLVYNITVTTNICSPDGQVLHSITHSIIPQLPALHNTYLVALIPWQ